MEIILDLPGQLVLKGDYVVLKPNITEKAFWEIANEDTNFELIDGVLVIHSPASTEHEEIFKYLMAILSYYLGETKNGKIFGSRLVMRLSETWNPEPDLMILTPPNFTRIKDTRIEGPADLVIEILSPATKEIDVTKKKPKYLAEGVKELWLIDPERKSVEIHWQDGVKKYDNSRSTECFTSRILPELQFQNNWLWARADFPENSIIKTMFSRKKK